eukprot:scaffold5074_cov99-Cylindrotheca_fusiformis.AAC.4
MVAHEVTLEGDERFDLNTLTLDQLRKLCRNVGITYANNCNKFACRRAIWIMLDYQSDMERDGKVIMDVDNTTSNILRITNILFSSCFLESFLKLNDSKKRTDYEHGGLPKDFWEDVAEAMNCSDDDDSTALKLVISEEDEHYEDINSIHLKYFDLMTASCIKKKVNQLLKVRTQMQKNMTISGEHDSDPYNFVELAMSKIGKKGLSILGCYYFFMRCEDVPEVDSRFSLEIDEVLKGSTENLPSPSPTKNNKNNTYDSKKRAYSAIVDISNTAKSIAVAMEETNKLAKQDQEIKVADQKIKVAQALGKDDILHDILDSMSSADG